MDWFDYAWLDVAWAIALLVLIPILVVSVVQIVRSTILSPLAKAAWIVFVILAPVLGVVAWLMFKPAEKRMTEGTPAAQGN